MRSFEEKRRPTSSSEASAPVHTEESTQSGASRPVASGLAHGSGPVAALPDSLRSGIESLSGISMDDVRVHRDSARPAQLDALAYAQGSQIHLGPGQEQHLPHEAWHVVQQRQGRVRPTMQLKSATAVNDDHGLEHEADVMGARAREVGRSGSAPVAAAVAPASVATGTVVHQLMSKKSGRKLEPITTLAELNAVLKDKALTLEELGDPKQATVDAVIAGWDRTIDGNVDRKSLLTGITDRLAKPATAKSTGDTRTDAARTLAGHNDGSGGVYYGGGANQPHVHVYRNGFHLKMPKRFDIVQMGIFYEGKLKEAREALTAARKGYLHAAIDRALLEKGYPLDTY